MKEQRPRLRELCVCITLTLACGETEVDPLDPSTFAGMHKAEIEYDCNQTVSCKLQMGMEVLPDPINECVRATAAHVEGLSDAAKMQFLVNYNSCYMFVVCDYFNCVQSDGAGWGQTQMDKVTYDCQQEIECGRVSGTFTGDIPTALNNCIAVNLGVLRNFTREQRDQYVTAFTQCGNMLSCDFRNCFPF